MAAHWFLMLIVYVYFQLFVLTTAFSDLGNSLNPSASRIRAYLTKTGGFHYTDERFVIVQKFPLLPLSIKGSQSWFRNGRGVAFWQMNLSLVLIFYANWLRCWLFGGGGSLDDLWSVNSSEDGEHFIKRKWKGLMKVMIGWKRLKFCVIILIDEWRLPNTLKRPKF